jgi:DNA-binding IclR family transcriptional regulator
LTAARARAVNTTKAPVARKRAPRKPARAAATEDGADSSLSRMLELLDLFTPAAPYWSADALIRYTGTSRSTVYRHLRALQAAGFLRPVANGNYIIGPRVIELDRQLRQTDPLFIAGEVPMKRLVAMSGHSALLCALFSDSVMCVREELAEDSPPNLFSRGQKRPLFNGAASKIILPYLPPHQLRSLFAKHKKTIATAGLGSDWDSFRANLAQVRRQGHIVTVGEFNPGLLGLSAPVFNHAGHILGSIGISGAASAFADVDMDALAGIVKAAADEVTARIVAMGSDLDLAPRAIG